MDTLSLAYLVIIVSGLTGASIAGYIHGKKFRNDKLVCPVGSDCEVVIYSKYSKFLGIPIENLGVIYYLTVALSYTVLFLFPKPNSEILSFFTLSITTLAFLFSLYLTYIQAVNLRQWCVWCLLSAGLCTIIFLSVWSFSEINLVEFLNNFVEHALFN